MFHKRLFLTIFINYLSSINLAVSETGIIGKDLKAVVVSIKINQVQDLFVACLGSHYCLLKRACLLKTGNHTCIETNLCAQTQPVSCSRFVMLLEHESKWKENGICGTVQLWHKTGRTN